MSVNLNSRKARKAYLKEATHRLTGQGIPWWVLQVGMKNSALRLQDLECRVACASDYAPYAKKELQDEHIMCLSMWLFIGGFLSNMALMGWLVSLFSPRAHMLVSAATIGLSLLMLHTWLLSRGEKLTKELLWRFAKEKNDFICKCVPLAVLSAAAIFEYILIALHFEKLFHHPWISTTVMVLMGGVIGVVASGMLIIQIESRWGLSQRERQEMEFQAERFNEEGDDYEKLKACKERVELANTIDEERAGGKENSLTSKGAKRL